MSRKSNADTSAAERAATLRRLFHLSEREFQVAALLLEGLRMVDAATRLGLSVETVRSHNKQILAKTGAKTRAGLILLSFELLS